MTDFVKVATVSDVPVGQGKCVQVDGREIALFNLDGKFYAIDNVCPHRGGPLSEGTLEGAEVISAPDNPLYTHSYIFNFGIPFKHTGIMTTTHVTPALDIYAGVDTGVNTTFGHRLDDFRSGDNNKAAAFHGGIGLNNLFNGALTILATTHIGPEIVLELTNNGSAFPVRVPCAGRGWPLVVAWRTHATCHE